MEEQWAGKGSSVGSYKDVPELFTVTHGYLLLILLGESKKR